MPSPHSRREDRGAEHGTSRSPRLPFLPLVPAIVLVIGLAVATAITGLGVEQLRQQSDEASALRAKALAVTLAERLRATPHQALAKPPPSDKPEETRPRGRTAKAASKKSSKAGAKAAKEAPKPTVADRMLEQPDANFDQVLSMAADWSGAEFLLVDATGRVVVDGSKQAPEQDTILTLLEVEENETHTSRGRAHFYTAHLAEPLQGLSLISFVNAVDKPYGTSSLVRSVAVFTLILVGVAAFVAYYLARSVHADVSYVRGRIVAMAAPDSAPAGQPIVVRAVDQVGRLTVAFNQLVERFYAAEQAYRQDLSGALNYERERSDFLAALSHELRTPLNVILGFADVLLSEVDGPLSEEARENLQVVRQSGAHLRSLINDILDLSALETGRLNLQLKTTDLWSVATDVVRESRLAAESKGLTIRLEGDPLQAVADQLRVRQVLGNLVSNAVKFTPKGQITVRLQAREDMASLQVTDTGPGIAPEDQAAVFEEYRQTGDWHQRGAGTGLGLAITRRLVRMHGGRIELKSRLGQGASFTVLLPIAGPKDQLTHTGHDDAPRGNTLRFSKEALSELSRLKS